MQDDSHLTEAQKKAKRAKKFSYRGVELEKLLDLSNTELMDLMNARQRRKFSRGTFFILRQRSYLIYISFKIT